MEAIKGDSGGGATKRKGEEEEKDNGCGIGRRKMRINGELEERRGMGSEGRRKECRLSLITLM